MYFCSLTLHNKQWKPIGELKQAQSECLQVAEILQTSAFVGAEATKKRFLSEIQHATVLHMGNLINMYFRSILE